MKLLGVGLSLLSALAITNVAHAAPATGTADLQIAKGSKVGEALDEAGVKVSALDPATGKAGAFVLPVTGLEVGPPLTASATGGLRLDAGKRTAKLKNLRLVGAGNDSKLRGNIGRKVMTLFSVKGVLTQTGAADAPKLSLDGAQIKLNGRAARKISRKLRIDRLPGARAGSLGISIDLAPSSTPPPEEEPPPDEEPQGEAYPYEVECPVARGSVTNAPQDAADPTAAPTLDLPQGVASTTEIRWGFYSSFRNYVINVPTAGSIQTLDGATASGANLADPSAYVAYSGATGTYEAGDEVNRSDDRLVATATGTTLFCKSGHQFNVVMKNPGVVLDGGQSRLTMDVAANYGGTWYPFQRVDIATLNLSAATPVPSDGGTVVTWTNIPATMTAEGAKAIGLPNYPAGTALDPVTVRTTLVRPFQSQCTLPTDGGTTPTVDFGLDPLPGLVSPQSAVSGQLNWGYRPGIRGTVQSGGSFVLLGGATRNDAGTGSMAGGAPGQKYFTWPFTSASYEEGTPGDPTDDRLIARSDATVVFCNVNNGSYGFAISKPTLVLDNANSRLTANATSFRSATFGGGRVDLLNITDVDPTYDVGAGTVTWATTVNGALTTDALTLAGMTPASTTMAWDAMTITIDLTP